MRKFNIKIVFVNTYTFLLLTTILNMNSNESKEDSLEKFRRGWEEELKNNSSNSSTSSEIEKRVGSLFLPI